MCLQNTYPCILSQLRLVCCSPRYFLVSTAPLRAGCALELRAELRAHPTAEWSSTLRQGARNDGVQWKKTFFEWSVGRRREAFRQGGNSWIQFFPAGRSGKIETRIWSNMEKPPSFLPPSVLLPSYFFKYQEWPVIAVCAWNPSTSPLARRQFARTVRRVFVADAFNNSC